MVEVGTAATLFISSVSLFLFFQGLKLFKAHNIVQSFIKEKRFEPSHDKPNKMACAPSEDSGQPGHPS